MSIETLTTPITLTPPSLPSFELKIGPSISLIPPPSFSLDTRVHLGPTESGRANLGPSFLQDIVPLDLLKPPLQIDSPNPLFSAQPEPALAVFEDLAPLDLLQDAPFQDRMIPQEEAALLLKFSEPLITETKLVEQFLVEPPTTLEKIHQDPVPNRAVQALDSFLIKRPLIEMPKVEELKLPELPEIKNLPIEVPILGEFSATEVAKNEDLLLTDLAASEKEQIQIVGQETQKLEQVLEEANFPVELKQTILGKFLEKKLPDHQRREILRPSRPNLGGLREEEQKEDEVNPTKREAQEDGRTGEQSNQEASRRDEKNYYFIADKAKMDQRKKVLKDIVGQDLEGQEEVRGDRAASILERDKSLNGGATPDGPDGSLEQIARDLQKIRFNRSNKDGLIDRLVEKNKAIDTSENPKDMASSFEVDKAVKKDIIYLKPERSYARIIRREPMVYTLQKAA